MIHSIATKCMPQQHGFYDSHLALSPSKQASLFKNFKNMLLQVCLLVGKLLFHSGQIPNWIITACLLKTPTIISFGSTVLNYCAE